MFALLQHGAEAAHAAESAHETAEHVPILAKFVNHYLGEYAYNFEMKYTYPKWKWLLAKFGSTPEAAFGAYTPENAIPWYTVMFILACIITVALIWIMKGKLSEDEPGGGQQTLEAGVLAIRSMLEDIIGPHGLQYFPVVMTFAVLILVSNLMGFFPLFMSPTSATSVTFALGLSSFVYYNYIGIKENGIFGHLRHFAGPIPLMMPLIFAIELISNLIRPFTLGIRLFANMFAGEMVTLVFFSLVPLGIPILFQGLHIGVAFIQTYIFVLLACVYLGEAVAHEH